MHRHFYENECIYVLDGEAEATIGGSARRVKPGDFIGYRAGGDAQKLVNTGHDVLNCIVVGQRLAHDVADYPEKGKRIYRNWGMKWNLVNVNAIDESEAGHKS